MRTRKAIKTQTLDRMVQWLSNFNPTSSSNAEELLSGMPEGGRAFQVGVCRLANTPHKKKHT
jgi:hypothetical protein